MRVTGLFRVLSVFLLITLAVCIEHNVHVTLEVTNNQINFGETTNFPIEIKYENKGEEISLPHFAIAKNENLKSKIFVIKSTTGNTPTYIGAIAKRSISPSYFFSFPSFQPITSQLNLLNFYHFEEDGIYSIQINVFVPLLNGENIHLTSNFIEVEVTGAFPYTPRGERAVAFSNCSPSETTEVTAQFPKQISAINAVLFYLATNINCPHPSLYEQFFGVYNITRYVAVFVNYDNILTLANGANFGINCHGSSCNPGDFAYVNPADTNFLINLCDSFWTASDDPADVDSKAGVLTHEMSHFDSVGDTLDYAYGVPNCLALAKSNPDLAYQNADSYEYLQEFLGSTPGDLPSNLSSDFFLSCDNSIPQVPSYDVIATTSTQFDLSNPFATVRGGSLTNYTNLVPGQTYSFRICTENNAGPGFDTVMVLRDPQGNVLRSNDNGDQSICGCNPLFSYIDYAHPSNAQYSWITISVYYYNPSSRVQSCTATVGRQREVNLYDQVSSGGSQCIYNLVCNPVTVFLNSTGLFTVIPSSLATASQACGLTITANKTIFSCADIGENEVLVTLYDRTCITTVTVVDNLPPTIVGCGTNVDIIYNYTSVNEDGKNPYCPEGQQCFVDVYSILPSQLAATDNCGSFTFEANTPDYNRLQPIGGTFNYDAVVEDSNGNTLSVQCPNYVVNAIHILDIIADDVFDEEYYFLDRSYQIAIEYDVPGTPNFQIALLPRGLQYALATSLINVSYSSFSNGLFSGVYFSSTVIEEGTYELLILTTNSNPVVSIGNPLVYIVGSN